MSLEHGSRMAFIISVLGEKFGEGSGVRNSYSTLLFLMRTDSLSSLRMSVGDTALTGTVDEAAGTVVFTNGGDR